MDGDFNVGRWYGENPAVLNQRVCAVRSSTPGVARFLEYALQQPLREVNAVSFSTTVKHLSSDQVENLALMFPRDVGLCDRVADFLDAETARIDALIDKQKKLIELLKEKRQAVISQAVAKGLDPNVPMKDSGVEWLGEVPAHWQVMKVKHAAKLESGHTPDRKIERYWADCTIPWVSLNDTKHLKLNDYITETAYSVNVEGIANSSARLLPERCVVFTRDATIGASAITTCAMAVSQHVIAWVCNERRVVPEYLLLAFYAMEKELDRYTFGATIKTIGMGDVRKLTVALPPVAEQVGIWQTSFESLRALDSAAAKAGVAIELLQERRAALITAAVTGQIDVSNYTPATEPAAA